MHENEITRQVVIAAIEVHRTLGPGLLESAYEMSLAHELELLSFGVQRQVSLPLVYKDIQCDFGYRLDLLIDNRVIVEIKAVDAINNVHIAQVLTYLKLTQCRVGLLINFNVRYLKQGIKRLVYKFPEK